MRPRLTLLRLFLAGALGLVLALGLLLAAFVNGSRRSILASAEQLREAAAARIEDLVRGQLGVARSAIGDFELEVRSGALDPQDAASIEAALFRTLQRSPSLAEVTFTGARREGFDAQGYSRLLPEGRWQISVFREDEALESELVRHSSGGFNIERRHREPGGALLGNPWQLLRQGGDPTDHLTFRTTASRRIGGEAIWSDLSYWQRDMDMPERNRRVVVTIQKAVLDRGRRFAGVVRAALSTETIDSIVRFTFKSSQYVVFIADREGRLVTRLSDSDRLALSDDGALRVQPADAPPAVRRALGEKGAAASAFELGGERWLATFRDLAGTQDWRLGIVVPEAVYTADLRRLRTRLLFISGALIAAIIIGSALVLLALRRSLGRLGSMAGRMRELDFAPSAATVPFGDVQEVVDGLERAKTAMRALGKYAPIDLVRELYSNNREPTLGGELRELSIFFSDLEGFTSLSERLSPDELARLLGAYLELMTTAIRSTGGTVDKFIGDAVMALWNAPSLRPGHARLACAAVLRCQKAARELYASPAWAGLPPLRTRFGLHRDVVMVGHFGSPERLSYTAVGDGVNLAARLESLCKQYGVTVLVSEAIVEEARAEFDFRLVDRVAVKGKSRAVQVYELLGAQGEAQTEVTRSYEQAFAAYSLRAFDQALALIDKQQQDGPSRVLADRCRALLADPPPPDWDGVHHSRSK